MGTFRNYEEVKKDLQETISYYDDRIKAWESVQIVTKKDGTPFKVYSKNFAGAEIGKYYPVEDYANPYLSVHFKHNGRYEWDQIELVYDGRALDDGLPEENPEREERISAWGVKRNIVTPAEAMTKVNNLISRYKDYKAEAEHELEHSKEYFDQIDAKCEEIRAILTGIKGDRMSSHIVYVLEDYIRDKTRFI